MWRRPASAARRRRPARRAWSAAPRTSSPRWARRGRSGPPRWPWPRSCQDPRVDEPFRDPGIPDGEATAYRGLVGGDTAGEGRMGGEATDSAYVQRISSAIGETGRGELEMRFAPVNPTVVAEHYRLDVRDGDRPVSVEEGWFRDVRVLQWGAEARPYPRSLTPLLGCAVALRGLDFERGARHRFALWLANSAFWEVEA